MSLDHISRVSNEESTDDFKVILIDLVFNHRCWIYYNIIGVHKLSSIRFVLHCNWFKNGTNGTRVACTRYSLFNCNLGLGITFPDTSIYKSHCNVAPETVISIGRQHLWWSFAAWHTCVKCHATDRVRSTGRSVQSDRYNDLRPYVGAPPILYYNKFTCIIIILIFTRLTYIIYIYKWMIFV